MPRIRTIKPEFFTSETVSALPLRARLTWIGLWTHCDDHGRARANVKLLKAAVWPLDNVSLRDIEEDLTALIAQGLIFTYTAEDGKNYLQVSGWAEHQKVDRPSKSPIPAPAGNRSARPAAHAAPSEPVDNPEYEESAQAEAHSRATREDSSSPREALAGERKGKERKGRDARARGAADPERPRPRALPPMRRAHRQPETARLHRLPGRPAHPRAVGRSQGPARPGRTEVPHPLGPASRQLLRLPWRRPRGQDRRLADRQAPERLMTRYGTCPTCGRTRALRIDGTIRNHASTRRSPHCAGSDRLPLRDDGTDPNPPPPAKPVDAVPQWVHALIVAELNRRWWQ